jgi:hypothetical protein
MNDNEKHLVFKETEQKCVKDCIHVDCDTLISSASHRWSPEKINKWKAGLRHSVNCTCENCVKDKAL